MSNIREQIVQEARSYIGTPFHHQGRLKGVGVDCGGLIVEVGKTFGLCNHDWHNYSRHPDGKTLIEQADKALDAIPISQARPGDILIFWIANPNLPQHVGIVSDYGLIHTYADVKKVVEHKLTEAWRKRIVKAYKYKGVE